MTGSKRTAKPQARRAAILDEAIRMLGEHGFNGLTVQALAQRCEISNAGLLYYFGSKDDLLLAVLDEFEQRERAVVTPLVEVIEKCHDDSELRWASVVGLLRQMVARFAERPDLARFLFVLQAEALDTTHLAHSWFREREQLSLDHYSSLLTSLVPDPVSAARHLIAMMHGLAQHWLRQDMGFDLPGEWEKMSRSVLSAHRLPQTDHVRTGD